MTSVSEARATLAVKSSPTRVIVGMSGGVDSSVAALLLQQQGYAVSGIFMKNWEDNDPDYPCTAKEDAIDALDVCEHIGIDMDAITFVDEYRERVFALFLEELRRGRTPNPDILCNKEIKFRAFLDYALAQGAERIATGHYARIVERDGLFELHKGRDAHKDQSYFLYALDQSQLSRTLFPVGELTKPQVRALAQQAGLRNHAKKDSTGICFIGERQFKRFLLKHLPSRPGDIRSVEGAALGRHDGLMYYTLGQRQGLGIGGVKSGSGEPWFVVQKNTLTNTLVVAQGENHPMLMSKSLIAENMNWIAGAAPATPFACHAKVRYRQADQACTVSTLDAGRYAVEFIEPQRAITPGQSVVLYQGDHCLGGGVIAATQDGPIL